MKPNEKKRVLVIEDDHHIAEGLNLNLSLQGYEVGIALNGLAGLQMWREWRPDLIVLDIMLPGIDGLSILRNIRLEDETTVLTITSPNLSAWRSFCCAWIGSLKELPGAIQVRLSQTVFRTMKQMFFPSVTIRLILKP